MDNIYVIYGENQFRINQAIEQIINNNKTTNIIKYDLTTASLNEVIIDAAMFSLFDDEKIIICENSNFLTGSKNQEEVIEPIKNNNLDELIKYLENPNSNSIIIFTTNNKLDDRKKIVKLLKSKAKVTEYSKPTYQDLLSYATGVFKENGYQISNDNLKYLLARTSNNYQLLNNEINKLLLYKLSEKEITKEDIDDLVYKQIEDDIFALIDNLVNNDKDKSFEIYQQLIINGEDPIKIMVILANQYRLIYQVKELSSQSKSESTIATYLGIHPYRVKLAKEKSHKFSEKQLKKYLEQLADLDYKIKNGLIDKYLGLEIFFLKL